MGFPGCGLSNACASSNKEKRQPQKDTKKSHHNKHGNCGIGLMLFLHCLEAPILIQREQQGGFYAFAKGGFLAAGGLVGRGSGLRQVSVRGFEQR
jgi:hypothetical protein